jgi:hypothetical protein
MEAWMNECRGSHDTPAHKPRNQTLYDVPPIRSVFQVTQTDPSSSLMMADYWRNMYEPVYWIKSATIQCIVLVVFYYIRGSYWSAIQTFVLWNWLLPWYNLPCIFYVVHYVMMAKAAETCCSCQMNAYYSKGCVRSATKHSTGHQYSSL